MWWLEVRVIVVKTERFMCIARSRFSALTLLVGRQEGYSACKKYEGWWRWALVGPDGVSPRRMIGVSASVNLPLHRKVQKFSSGTGSPGWSRKKGHKTVVVCGARSRLWNKKEVSLRLSDAALKHWGGPYTKIQNLRSIVVCLLLC